MAKVMVCTECGNIGPAKRKVRGSTGMEIVLWLLILVPGIIYSVWRSSSRHWVCGVCGSTSVIPPNTPRGQKIMHEHLSNEEVDRITKEEQARSSNAWKKYAIGAAIVLFGLPFLMGALSALFS